MAPKNVPEPSGEDTGQHLPQQAAELSSLLTAAADPTPAHGTQLNCPYCNTRIEVQENNCTDVTCPTCGSSFPLSGPLSTITWVPEKLLRLDKFELFSPPLGQGQFGTVYRARDTVLNRPVAIKIPRGESFATRQDEERFEREAQAAAALDHPGIVRVLEFGRGPAFPYIVSEYVQGITLADALTGRQFTAREAAEIVAQLAEALDHAHRQQVIHRDVKPANIMLAGYDRSSPDLRPRVMDFGLARREDGEALTREGQVLGTLGYTSPEQARGEGLRAGRGTDIYALGVILYELLTGERPFRGNYRMLIHQVIYEEPRSPRTLNDQVPRDLETITLKCLAKEAQRRYSTAGALAADLHRWLAGEPIQARPVRTPERLWLWCRRRPAVASLLGALFLACVTGTVGVTWQWFRAERHRAEATRRFQEARREVDTFLTGTGALLKYYPGAQRVRARLLERAAEEYQRFANEQSDSPELRTESGRAFLRLGDVQSMLEQPAAAAEAYRSAWSVFDQLARQQPRATELLLERANSQTKLGIAFQELGQSREADQAYRAALAELQPLVQAEPHVQEYRDALGTAWHDLGRLQDALGQTTEAEASLRAALGEFEAVVTAADLTEPHERQRARFALASVRNTWGLMLAAQGDSLQAVEIFQKGIRDFEALDRAEPDHPDYVQARADSRDNLANTLRALGRADEAQKQYLAVLDDYQALLKAWPDVPAFRANLAQAQINLGQLLHHRGLNPQAKQRLEQATSTLAELLAEHPRIVEYHEKSAIARITLAQILRDLGDTTTAETLLRSAVQTFAELIKREPRPAYRELLAVTRNSLARVLHQTGAGDDAQQAFATGIAELQTLIREVPTASAYRDDLAWAYAQRGDLLRELGQVSAAAADYDQVITLRQQLAKNQPSPNFLYQLAWFLTHCPDPARRQPAAALQFAQQAKDLAPANPDYWNLLGMAYYRADKSEDSLLALDEAVKLRRTGHCLDWFALALACRRAGESEKAQSYYEQGVRWLEENCPGDMNAKRHRDEVSQCLEVAVPAESAGD